MRKEIVINKTFCGPTESGQGGYVSGLLGGFIEGSSEVTLRVPPPLNQTLEIDMSDKDLIKLLNGDTIVAQAIPSKVEFNIPKPPTYEEAIAASESYIGFKQHAFPKCFVCGPERLEGDGLRIFPGQISGKDLVAAPWIPYKSLADENGNVKNEFIWAALDCAGGFAAIISKLRLIVLGKLAVSIEHDIQINKKYIVIGWPIMIEGRKLLAGTAIFTESGKLCAKAKATWIDLNVGK
jgi:hypothetical protein